MSPQINHHPSNEMLEQFHRGELPPGVSVAISAHLELCGECAQQTLNIAITVSEEWNQRESKIGCHDLDDLVNDILSQPQQVTEPVKTVTTNRVHLMERSVSVPLVLAKAAGQELVWKKLPGGINYAPMALDRGAQCDLLYMKPGSQIPPHKHQGTEITLVLDGSFNDEAGRYHTGDFIVRTQKDSHAASSDDGCLCFTVLDSPVVFTSGMARLFNPLNRYLFNRIMK